MLRGACAVGTVQPSFGVRPLPHPGARRHPSACRACAGSGTMPSWCSRRSGSQVRQWSAIVPSTTRLMAMPGTRARAGGRHVAEGGRMRARGSPAGDNSVPVGEQVVDRDVEVRERSAGRADCLREPVAGRWHTRIGLVIGKGRREQRVDQRALAGIPDLVIPAADDGGVLVSGHSNLRGARRTKTGRAIRRRTQRGAVIPVYSTESNDRAAGGALQSLWASVTPEARHGRFPRAWWLSYKTLNHTRCRGRCHNGGGWRFKSCEPVAASRLAAWRVVRRMVASTPLQAVKLPHTPTPHREAADR